MKNLTLIEITLLIVITGLSLWVGASSWQIIKRSAQARETVRNTGAPLAPRHDSNKKYLVKNNVQPAVTKNAPIENQAKGGSGISTSVARAVADQNTYVAELLDHPVLASLATRPDVVNFLGILGKGEDFSSLFGEDNYNDIQQYVKASGVLINSVTNCLIAPKACGVKDLGSNYRIDGQHPLETILWRALNYAYDAEANGFSVAQASNEEVMRALRIPQNNVQIYAAKLLAERNLSDQELIDTFNENASVQGPAKVAFFSQFGKATIHSDADVRGAYLNALDKTLLDNSSSDLDGTMQVYENLQAFDLTPTEFHDAALNACKIGLKFQDDDSRERFFTTIENNARLQGYAVDFDDLCSAPSGAGAAGPGAVGG